MVDPPAGNLTRPDSRVCCPVGTKDAHQLSASQQHVLPSMQDGMPHSMVCTADAGHLSQPQHRTNLGAAGYITPHDMHGAAARYRMTLHARVSAGNQRRSKLPSHTHSGKGQHCCEPAFKNNLEHSRNVHRKVMQPHDGRAPAAHSHGHNIRNLHAAASSQGHRNSL